MIKHLGQSLIILLVSSSALLAQSIETGPPVSTLLAVLTSSLESKSATSGERFTLRTTSDVVVDGQLVIPRDSKVLGHVAEAVTKGKDQPRAELWIVIDVAVRRDGFEIPLQAIIAALAAPQKDSLADDPTYGMMHSSEPNQSGVGVGSASAAGALPAASKSGSTASVATANLKGGMDKHSVLDENSRGAIGYQDISLAWHLVAPPPVTVISSNGKNVKLLAGTQVLLRMAPPRLPR